MMNLEPEKREERRTHLQITRLVQQQIARLQVAMQHIGRVNVLEAAQDLVQEIADVIVAQPLRLQQLVQIGLHQALHDVHVTHAVYAVDAQNVADIDDLMRAENVHISCYYCTCSNSGAASSNVFCVALNARQRPE